MDLESGKIKREQTSEIHLDVVPFFSLGPSRSVLTIASPQCLLNSSSITTGPILNTIERNMTANIPPKTYSCIWGSPFLFVLVC